MTAATTDRPRRKRRRKIDGWGLAGWIFLVFLLVVLSAAFGDFRSFGLDMGFVRLHANLDGPRSFHFGVNDMEGTMVREKIYHEAGAHTAQAMTLEAILKLIRGAGKVPAERDSFYHVLRTFDGPPPDGTFIAASGR